MNKDRSASETLIRGLEGQGFKAIMLTVDAAVPGNREIDKRSKGFTVRSLFLDIIDLPVCPHGWLRGRLGRSCSWEEWD